MGGGARPADPLHTSPYSRHDSRFRPPLEDPPVHAFNGLRDALRPHGPGYE